MRWTRLARNVFLGVSLVCLGLPEAEALEIFSPPGVAAQMDDGLITQVRGGRGAAECIAAAGDTVAAEECIGRRRRAGMHRGGGAYRGGGGAHRGGGRIAGGAYRGGAPIAAAPIAAGRPIVGSVPRRGLPWRGGVSRGRLSWWGVSRRRLPLWRLDCPGYGWAPGGAIAAGAALGFVSAAAAASWAGAAPGPGPLLVLHRPEPKTGLLGRLPVRRQTC